MSTWMYLQCEDHDPPIRAREESGQHWYDLPRIRAEVANRGDLLARMDAGDFNPPAVWTGSNLNVYFPRNSAMFLRDHPNCRITIWTEYDENVTEESTDD